MPSLHSLLSADRVHVGLDVETKADVLRAMVGLAETAPEVTDADALLASVEAREALISTGVGEGLALPHARTSAVSGTVVCLATLAAPVGYDALDGQPVVMVVFLAGPEGERGEHVRLLSRISRVVADPDARQRILSADDAEGVLHAIAEAEASLV
ncbi:MAG: PTS sugar transporter subunit IIA [Bacteroidota bacterium]